MQHHSPSFIFTNPVHLLSFPQSPHTQSFISLPLSVIPCVVVAFPLRWNDFKKWIIITVCFLSIFGLRIIILNLMYKRIFLLVFYTLNSHLQIIKFLVARLSLSIFLQLRNYHHMIPLNVLVCIQTLTSRKLHTQESVFWIMSLITLTISYFIAALTWRLPKAATITMDITCN